MTEGNRPSNRSDAIVNFSLTELMVLMVFIFLVVIAIISNDLLAGESNLELLKQEKEKAQKYRDVLGEVSNRLGFELSEDWDYLVPLKLMDRYEIAQLRKKLELRRLQKEINKLSRDNETYRSRLGSLLAEKAELMEQLSIKSPSLAEAHKVIAKINKEKREKDIKIFELEYNLAELGGKLKWQEKQRRKLNTKGLTVPSCWFKESGKIDFLMTVTMRNTGFILSHDWSTRRQKDARGLGLDTNIFGKEISQNEFAKISQPIYDAGKVGGILSEPQENYSCRYFVHVVDQTSNKGSFIRQLATIERYYYKSFK